MGMSVCVNCKYGYWNYFLSDKQSSGKLLTMCSVYKNRRLETDFVRAVNAMDKTAFIAGYHQLGEFFMFG